MMNRPTPTDGCSEEFRMLCALSTSGELSSDEQATLDEHVAKCAPCAALLGEYTSLAHVGMAKLAAEREQDFETPYEYDSGRAEDRFLDAFRAASRGGRPNGRKRPSSPIPSPVRDSWNQMKRAAIALGIAASLLIAVGGAFELGRRVASAKIPSTIATVSSAAAKSGEDTARLKSELAVARSSLEQIAVQASQAQNQVAELSVAKAALVAQVADLTKEDTGDISSLAAVSQQRDDLQQQLADSSAALTRARDDLSRAQQDRRGALYRVATLETEVNDLNSQLSHVNTSATSDENFLAADRDIRELMGARQLYIADVFDVQNDGERSKPFGRVFYTKGKSLIFYAFDLQKQPGYHEARAFQAWGKPDSSSGKPISLGIFYEDNEQNRRWVVKSDNPDVLAQINAVFVTVEPKGGSPKPTGKPFLEAYLHSLPPNHP